MTNNNKQSSVILLVIFLLVIYFVGRNGQRNNEDIKKNKYKTICFVNKYGAGGGRGKNLIYFYYYFNKIKYESNEIVEYPKLYFNKFFEMELSSKNPKNNKILLNREVMDSKLIFSAGFQYK